MFSAVQSAFERYVHPVGFFVGAEFPNKLVEVYIVFNEVKYLGIVHTAQHIAISISMASPL